MIWRIAMTRANAGNVDQPQPYANGQVLEVTQSFLSMTKRSMYIEKGCPDHKEDRVHVISGPGQLSFCLSFAPNARMVFASTRAAAGK